MPKLDPRFVSTPLAHRALHDVKDGRPENSRAAIRAAIDHGYGIEIDLQLSADGVAMVFHDYQLERLAEAKGAVRQRTAAELGDIPLKGGDEGIPTFAEVLDLVAGRVPLLVEIKDQDGVMGPNVGVLEEAAARDVEGYNGPLAFMSFNPHSVAKLAEYSPDVPRGIVTDGYSAEDWLLLKPETREKLRGVQDYERVGACFISHQVSDLGRDRVAELKASGAHVFTWTIRSPEQEAQAREVAENVTFEGYLAEIPAA
ncbi:glycerophosphoryl diester phosphodiesterase [Shimia isoporae]|uniref:Glycerophosphoryl diester phosphodiesterase n=2 Tax=Shimia isoporae TaxID=647720 RepID=A0A4R1N3P7_9RHOB|nr:glycerophosphodiester phosphodiesterase family protein [Shimia isoporae]TCL01246.1 glycerophosphoryl diester phosphodiesterase [Shimia isoporae]